jgi:hypothetical protein
MKTRIALMVALVGGIAVAANAQSPQVNGSNVAYNFSWTNSATGTPTALNPGQSAVISLTISMTPTNGSAITWNTEIGGTGTGLFRGLQAAFFDLVGGATAAGTWSNLLIDELWELPIPNAAGTPVNNGARLNNIQIGQFPASQAQVNVTNPIEMVWTGTWTPDSYAERTENFAMANGNANPGPFPSFVIVRDPTINTTVLVGTSAHSGGTFSIPIVPAPSSLALLGLGGLVAARRRR